MFQKLLLTNFVLTGANSTFSYDNNPFYLNETTDLQDIIKPTIECMDELTNNATVAVKHTRDRSYAFEAVGEESKFGNVTHIDELQDCIDLYSESGLVYTVEPTDESTMQPLMRLRIDNTEVIIQTEHSSEADIIYAADHSDSDASFPWSTLLPVANDISAQKQIR